MRSLKCINPGQAGRLARLIRLCLACWLPLACLWMAAFGVGVARSQTTLSAEEKLEQEFTDPLATLPQVIIRDSFAPANYGTHVQTNQLIVRPLIPRVPP